MRYSILIFGFFSANVLFTSCGDEENIPVIKNYTYKQFSSDLNNYVNCVTFIDTSVGFAAGSGKIFKTVDSGIHWQIDNIVDLPVNSLFFINNDIGFAVGGKSGCGGSDCNPPGSMVYKTVNKGQTWGKQSIPYRWSELNSVFFVDERIGFAIGLGLHIKTVDGGETWEPFEFEYKGAMKKVYFINSNTGFAAGLFGNIFKTTDQGEKWYRTKTDSDGHIYDFYFVDENLAYAGGQKNMLKTMDGGETWEILPDSPAEIYFIHFANAINGIAVGKGHYTGGDFGTLTNAIYSTSNGGELWEIEDNIDFGSIISFPESNTGYSIVKNYTYKIQLE